MKEVRAYITERNVYVTNDENRLLSKKDHFLMTYIEHKGTISQYPTTKQIPPGMHVRVSEGKREFNAESEQIRQVETLSEEEYQSILNEKAGCFGLFILKQPLEKRVLAFIKKTKS